MRACQFARRNAHPSSSANSANARLHSLARGKNARISPSGTAAWRTNLLQANNVRRVVRARRVDRFENFVQAARVALGLVGLAAPPAYLVNRRQDVERQHNESACRRMARIGHDSSVRSAVYTARAGACTGRAEARSCDRIASSACARPAETGGRAGTSDASGIGVRRREKHTGKLVALI